MSSSPKGWLKLLGPMMDKFILKGWVKIIKSNGGQVHPNGWFKTAKSIRGWAYPKGWFKIVKSINGWAHPKGWLVIIGSISERVQPKGTVRTYQVLKWTNPLLSPQKGQIRNKGYHQNDKVQSGPQNVQVDAQIYIQPYNQNTSDGYQDIIKAYKGKVSTCMITIGNG